MDLSQCEIVGFFSLPSPELAEHNPSAYTAAMAAAPPGSGTCAHCGTGIRHHVIVVDGGITQFIGTTCAVKAGVPKEAVQYRLTSEQLAARKARFSEWCAKKQAEEDAARAHLVARREKVGDIVDILRRIGGNFYSSLAEQLERGPLSWRQAQYVAKATSSTGRRNKKNAASFDSILERCTDES